MKATRTRYVLTVEPTDSDVQKGIRRLRRLLKSMWRQFGIRVVNASKVSKPVAGFCRSGPLGPDCRSFYRTRVRRTRGRRSIGQRSESAISFATCQFRACKFNRPISQTLETHSHGRSMEAQTQRSP